MAKATTTSTVSAFATIIAADARKVTAALVAFDRAASKTSEAIASAMNDIVAKAEGIFEKSEAGTKALMALVRENAVFQAAVAEGLIESKTLTEYAQGVGRAFYHGVEWTPRLKNDKAYALPWGKAKASDEGVPDTGSKPESKAKPGKPAKVTRDTAFEQARQLLATLRALNLTTVAADVLDVLLEELEGFSETTV